VNFFMLLSKLIVSLKNKNTSFLFNKNYLDRLKELIFYLNNNKDFMSIKLLRDNLRLIKGNNGGVFVSKNDLVRYIINIKFTESNTLVNVTDISGNPKVFVSSGTVGLKGKMKKYHPTALVKILKYLALKINFVGFSPVAVHFRGAKRYHIILAIKLLKTKVFIKTIRNYNLKAYNGCRPRKLKRLKQRSL